MRGSNNFTELNADPAQLLGDELRTLRKTHGMTLEALAEKSSKSVSFISKIERGLARPSIAALQDIADAFEVPIGWFFQSGGPVPQDERSYIVRADRRRRLTYSGFTSSEPLRFEDYLLSTNLDGQLALGISYFKPGETTDGDICVHMAEEAGLVIEGQIELRLNQNIFTLDVGDSFSFPPNTPHSYRNLGSTRAAIVWANTPVTLRR